MGLFSKREETRNDAPPVPQAPNARALGAPPAPAAAVEIPKPTVESNNLRAPPIPGGSLDDIKEQVAAKQTESNDIKEEEDTTEEPSNEDDSLFDFSELDVNTPINSEVQTGQEVSTQVEGNENVDLSFIKHRQKQIIDTYFVTTSQFKSLLEIVENVKNKVKDASETHLKLLDIKAEEDIEFENLRKDFQFIEDKLYEVDNIIFDK